MMLPYLYGAGINPLNYVIVDIYCGVPLEYPAMGSSYIHILALFCSVMVMVLVLLVTAIVLTLYISFMVIMPLAEHAAAINITCPPPVMQKNKLRAVLTMVMVYVVLADDGGTICPHT